MSTDHKPMTAVHDVMHGAFDPKNLMLPRDYLQGREHILQSSESLRWFIRSNRTELMRRGAIVAPAGRKMLVADAFDQAVVEIGAKRAALLGA